VLPALTIAQIYKSRWQVELFFKWIKQHLRIKAFFGTSENAVKTQIWIAVSVYVLVAIVRKRLRLETSLYQILQIFSLTLFEKVPILQALQPSDSQNESGEDSIQSRINKGTYHRQMWHTERYGLSCCRASCTCIQQLAAS